MISWRKSLEQSFVVFYHFSRSCEVTKFLIRRKWSHTGECTKYFIPSFLCIFLLILWKKTFYTVLWSFWPFLMNLWTFKVLNDKTGSKWRHRREWTYVIHANFSLRVIFWRFWLIPILLYGEKGSFYAKVIPLVPDPLEITEAYITVNNFWWELKHL